MGSRESGKAGVEVSKVARTEMMFHPSIEECVKAAVSHGMPEAEGRKFFFHYESNGWKVGKIPMKSFAGAMGGWNERWLERGGVPAGSSNGNGNHPPKPLSGADKMIKRDEYQRVVDRLKQLDNDFFPTYPDEKKVLRARRDELRKALGVLI